MYTPKSASKGRNFGACGGSKRDVGALRREESGGGREGERGDLANGKLCRRKTNIESAAGRERVRSRGGPAGRVERAAEGSVVLPRYAVAAFARGLMLAFHPSG